LNDFTNSRSDFATPFPINLLLVPRYCRIINAPSVTA